MYLDFEVLQTQGITATLCHDNSALVLEFNREWSERDRKNFRTFSNGLGITPREQDETMDAIHRIQMIHVLRDL